MRREQVFATTLAGLLALGLASFSALGVRSPDEYYALFAVEYFALYTVLPPRKRFRDPVSIVVFVVFAIIVVHRVLVILS
ncbi:MAG: hypothetical protein QW429_01940 [Thermoprotei archaeon]